MTLDSNVMADWGAMGTDGLIGGAGISDKILYYGFLMQQSEETGTFSGGPELYRNGRELLGLGYHNPTSTQNMGGFFYDSSNTIHGLNFVNDALDSDIHLFVVKLMYGADGTGDDALIFIDPDMSLPEDEQDPLHVYKLSDLTEFPVRTCRLTALYSAVEDHLRLTNSVWQNLGKVLPMFLNRQRGRCCYSALRG